MRIGVVGAGAWGTALAQVMAQGGDVLLWALEKEVADAVNQSHLNPLYLPDVPSSPASPCRPSKSRPPMTMPPPMPVLTVR